jgi:hypothetical protein
MLPVNYHTTKKLPDNLLETLQSHTTLERILVWTTTIAAMTQMDEFSSDIVIAIDEWWIVYDVT